MYIPGMGDSDAKLLILTDAPTYDEVKAGRFGSKQLEYLLKDAKINPRNCWLTGVSKYFVRPSDVKKIPFQIRAKLDGVDVQEQIDDLRHEIQTINPNVILALGSTPLWALTGKTDLDSYRGSILSTWLGKKLVATYNPRHLNYGEKGETLAYWQKQIILFDFKRALLESSYPDIILPQRNLSVCKSSAQLEMFIERHSDKSKLAIDIENGESCIPTCIGIAFSSDEGLVIDLWNGLSDSDLASTWIILARLLVDKRFKKIGQNFKFDEDKIYHLGFLIDKLSSDTMLKAFTINPELPKNLAFNTSIYTREPFYKNEGMYEGSHEDLLIGCARDACVTLEVDDAMDKDLDEMHLRSYYDNFVMKLHSFYLRIEREGLCVDEAKREELLRKYISWDERLKYEMFKMTNQWVNTGSWQQVSKLLYDTLKVPGRVGTSEEVLTQLLNGPVKDAHRRAIIANILDSRRVRKTISNNLSAIRDYDGKMRTTFFPCLETGRSSTGQQEAPIRPTEIIIEVDETGKQKKKKKALGASFQTMTKHGDIGPEVRLMYIPEPNHVFIQADSSQAEARVIFLLAKDDDALRDIDTHDYHALTASWFFGKTEDDYSKKKLGYEHPIRFAGKTLRHAGHLGAKARRASIEVNTQARKYKIDYQISEYDARRALEIFHKKQPKIQQVFQAGVIAALEKNRMLEAPIPYGVDATVGGTRIFYERWGDELFRQAFSYIPQRTVSENTKGAGMRIFTRAPVRIVSESHDALIFMIREELVSAIAPIIKEEFERPIDFTNCTLSRGQLVIPCELEIGYNLYEMSKFKEPMLI